MTVLYNPGLVPDDENWKHAIVLPKPARQYDRPLKNDETRVNGSRGTTSLASGPFFKLLLEGPELSCPNNDRGDACSRASNGSYVHSSHRSRVACVSPTAP